MFRSDLADCYGAITLTLIYQPRLSLPYYRATVNALLTHGLLLHRAIVQILFLLYTDLNTRYVLHITFRSCSIAAPTPLLLPLYCCFHSTAAPTLLLLNLYCCSHSMYSELVINNGSRAHFYRRCHTSRDE